MARKPMVTRTILTTKVVALCLDIQTAEPQNVEVTLPRTFKDEEKLLKAIRETADTETVKVVSIVSVETVETLYGMTEQAFINGAVVLDPQTRKVIEAECEEETADEE